MPSMLIVDDDLLLSKLVLTYAQMENYQCREAEADIIIMDVMMPGKDGFETQAELWRFTQAPVIILTVRGWAVLKRSGTQRRPASLVFGGLVIQSGARSVTVDGRAVSLPPKEFDLLLKLTENGEVVGNVEFIARTIREETGGDLLAIKTVQTYPGENQDLLSFSAAECSANVRPERSTNIDSLDNYDVIFLGYPIWWDRVPAMIATFLSEKDFSGKVVAPFCTSSYSSTTASAFSRSWPPA